MNILWGWDISHFTGDILWHVSISKTFEIWYPISICLYFDSLKLYRNVFVHQTELWVPTWYVCSQKYYRNTIYFQQVGTPGWVPLSVKFVESRTVQFRVKSSCWPALGVDGGLPLLLSGLDVKYKLQIEGYIGSSRIN